LLGKIIQGHIITEKIADGGMGVVYKACNKVTGDFVAIKTLSEQFAKNSQVYNRFLNEANILRSLQHENIPAVIDLVDEGNALYLVMEFIEGNDLDYFIKHESGPLNEHRLYAYLKNILSTTSYLHKKGIIHRDIKPANFIVNDDRLKLLDFGISKDKQYEENINLTTVNMQLGTPMYMSPEQVMSSGIDSKSDIYSIGVVLYEMLTGKPPYKKGDDVKSKIIYEDFPNPIEIYPSAIPFYVKCVKKATAKEKTERFKDCADWLQELEEYNQKRLAELKQIKEEAKEDQIEKKTEVNKPEEQKVSEYKSEESKKRRFLIPWIVTAVGLIGVSSMVYINRPNLGKSGSNKAAKITIFTDSLKHYCDNRLFNNAQRFCDSLEFLGENPRLKQTVFDNKSKIDLLKDEINQAIIDKDLSKAKDKIAELLLASEEEEDKIAARNYELKIEEIELNNKKRLASVSSQRTKKRVKAIKSRKKEVRVHEKITEEEREEVDYAAKAKVRARLESEKAKKTPRGQTIITKAEHERRTKDKKSKEKKRKSSIRIAPAAGDINIDN